MTRWPWSWRRRAGAFTPSAPEEAQPSAGAPSQDGAPEGEFAANAPVINVAPPATATRTARPLMSGPICAQPQPGDVMYERVTKLITDIALSDMAWLAYHGSPRAMIEAGAVWN